MQSIVGAVYRGASGYHVAGGVVVDHYDVVEVLDGFVLSEHHTGLDREFQMVSRLNVDEIPVGLLLVGLGRVLVLGGIHGVPIIVLDPAVGLHGLLGTHYDESVLGLVGAVAHGIVDEEDRPVLLGVVGVDADVDHLLLEVVGGVFEALDLLDVLLALVVLLHVDIVAVGGLFTEGLPDLFLVDPAHSSSTPYPFCLISSRMALGSPSLAIFPWMRTKALSAPM